MNSFAHSSSHAKTIGRFVFCSGRYFSCSALIASGYGKGNARGAAFVDTLASGSHTLGMEAAFNAVRLATGGNKPGLRDIRDNTNAGSEYATTATLSAK